MRALFVTVLLAATAVVQPLAMAVTSPGANVSYSADSVMETAEGAITGKHYIAPGMERREDTLQGMSMISIRRDDLGKLWMLMPSERMYMEIDLKKAADMAERFAGGMSRTPSPEEFEVEMTEEGREEVNGLMTTKSKVIMKHQDGTRMGGFWWMSDEGILVKMDVIAMDESKNKMRMKRELTNIVIEPQAPTLFEIPEGYSSLMMGMGAGLLGLPGLGGGGADEPSESGEEGATEEPPKKKWGLDRLKGVLDAVQ
jgi:hypothetical protein